MKIVSKGGFILEMIRPNSTYGSVRAWQGWEASDQDRQTQARTGVRHGQESQAR